MKEFAGNYINLIFRLGLSTVILSTLLLFTNITSESFETPKFLVLLTFTGVILFLAALKFTIANKVVLSRTPLDLPLLLLLITAIISTFLSPNLYISLLGNNLKVSTGLVGIVVSTLFYFILVNNFKSLKNIRFYIHLSIAGGAILSILTLCAYWGVKFLQSSWNQTLNFTPTGSSFSTSAVLSLMTPLLVWGIMSSTNILFKAVNALLLTLFGITIALIGGMEVYIASILGILILLFVNARQIKSHLLFLAVPLVLITLSAGLSFIPPVGSAQNPFYSQRQNFPREIQLPFDNSWKIAISSFRDKPFFGTGPSTFIFNFTQYKPLEFNQTKFWNLRFESSFNEYLNILSALGGIGILGLLLMTAIFISSAWESFGHPSVLEHSLAVSGLSFFAILALHSSTLVLWIIGFLILSLYMAVKRLDHPDQLTLGGSIPSFLFIISLFAVLTSFFFGAKFILADYHHRLALKLAKNNGLSAYQQLVKAEVLNPYNEVYRLDLAQTNFSLANAIALAKGPSEASPSGSLTDEDKKNIQQLLQQSITEGRVAVQISPRSAIAWEVLASIYRQISGVATNGLQFSLDSYGRAIKLDPLNPLLRLAVGGVYYQIKNYDLAVRFFDDAVSLKPDFPNGLYNLAIALREKGSITEAKAVTQRLVDLLKDKTDSADYKLASELLSDLKSQTPSDTTPPAANQESALEKKNLPQVLNLPKPQNIATPEAVKK